MPAVTGFEPLSVDCSVVAQLIEQSTNYPKFEGSNPVTDDTEIKLQKEK